MALNGPQALKSLDEAIYDIRNEENEIGKRLARCVERLEKLREAEAELFQQLAAVRVDVILDDGLTTQLSHAEKRVREALDAHTKQIKTLENDLASLEDKLNDRINQRETLLDELNESQAGLRSISHQIAQEIKKDPAYLETNQRAEHLREIAEKSMRKTAQAEADQEQKGRPYRDDPLFMYLWEIGYNTRNYKANNLVRWLDSLVARLINYNDARPNFIMLNEIPMRVREHAERQIAAAEDAEDAIDALETKAIDAAGGQKIRENLERIQHAIENMDTSILTLENERDEKATSFRHLAEGRDPNFKQARDLLIESLEDANIARLFDAARDTPTPKDDKIVAKIDDTRRRMADEEDDKKDHRTRLKVLATRRKELEDIEFEFKKARFDDPRSTFREDNLAGDLLNEFLKGAVSASTYWGQWQKNQRWTPGTTDWGGGVGLPRSGRSERSAGSSRSPWTSSSSSNDRNPWGRSTPSSNGGFSRPRSRPPSQRSSGSRKGSKGRRKSGGFKTGGGF